VKEIQEYLLNISDEKEIEERSTIRKFRTVRIGGKSALSCEISDYSLQGVYQATNVTIGS